MHITWAIAFASVIVGFTVGLTGMGGGALMTPILLIFFGISPTTAVSSDLVAAMVMKPVGGGVHIRRRTVRWELVKWLCVGSIPTAFAGVLLLNLSGDSETVQNTTKIFLGVTLTLAAAAMVFKAWLQGRRSAQARAGLRATLGPGGSIRVRIPITVLIGAFGGLMEALETDRGLHYALVKNLLELPKPVVAVKGARSLTGPPAWLAASTSAALPARPAPSTLNGPPRSIMTV